ncbi:ABC transporter substrate-binding protein [Ketobacter sp.]|nr:MAG: hypothetical protein D6160_09275 [Ketobacter sp.]
MIQARCLVILIFAMVITNCARITPDPAGPVPLSKNKILVVNSNHSLPRYQLAENGFMEALAGKDIVTLDLNNDERPTEQLLDVLNTQQFAAIYTIGAKALGSVDYIDPAAQVIYSSVLSWRQFQSRDNYFGVASEVAPHAQMTWFKYFFPQLKRIGVIYSEDNAGLVKDGERFANQLGIELVSAAVTKVEDLPRIADQLLQKVDALWVLPDPVVLKSESSTKLVFDLAHRRQRPVFAYSSLFMELGATLSINADLATTGRQAAVITQTLLEQQQPESHVQFPAGSSISLNLLKVGEYQLDLNTDALGSVNELLTQ